MTCARFQVRHNLQLMDLIWHFVKYWAYFRTPLSLFLCPSLYFPADFVRDAYRFVGDSGSCDRPALYCPEEVMAIRGHHWFLGGKRTTTNVSFSDFYWTVAYPEHSGHRLVTSSLWLDLGLASCLGSCWLPSLYLFCCSGRVLLSLLTLSGAALLPALFPCSVVGSFALQKCSGCLLHAECKLGEFQRSLAAYVTFCEIWPCSSFPCLQHSWSSKLYRLFYESLCGRCWYFCYYGYRILGNFLLR